MDPKMYKIKICSFKLVQKEIVSKNFYKQSQITEIFLIEENKTVFSDGMPWNNGKDWWYFVGYDDAIFK